MRRMTQSDVLAYEAKRAAKIPPLYSAKGCDDEGELQQTIENHLKSLGSTCWYVRQRMDKPTTQRCGVPDFIGWHRGKPFAIECKRKGQKPTLEQRGELRWCLIAGGYSGVAYSLEDAIRILNGGETN